MEEDRMSQLVSVSEHCDRLYRLLTELPYAAEEWPSAADWIHIASSIKSVDLDTTRFDNSVLWCSAAWEYESKRSTLLTQFVSHLTVFTFVWGGLETIIKIISPMGFDSKQARELHRKGTMIDRAIYYLKTQYDPVPRVPLYDDTLAQLRLTMQQLPDYRDRSQLFKEDALTSLSGLGLHVVRTIRNDLAHGSSNIPIPDDWGNDSTKFSDSELREFELIEQSSRIILLTIQMLLLAYYKAQDIVVSVLKDDDGCDYDEDLHIVARYLHLATTEVNENQLRLF